ncbi:MAG TPA: cyclodeaminase/cyclohydrolase family protein [Tepidisphaeraceae bacterium]|jgi:formiminotetrahydrofolate cyclodeaminase|nr:cyclodeaminase/cyclohydrolase family protein [Tepidisphaeraceae bacterium]
MHDRNTTIQNFLDAAAARQPTPGGGSIAALCGALSTSMGEMVLNYSIGKKDLAAYEGELLPALQGLHRARVLMLELMVEDQAAYAAVTAARKLPPGPEQDAQLKSAVIGAIRTPETIGATAVAILQTCDQVINFVNYHLLSDLAICADLAMATARCAVYNVRVNLTEITDPAERQRIESRISQILSHAATLIQRISPRVWGRHAEGA